MPPKIGNEPLTPAEKMRRYRAKKRQRKDVSPRTTLRDQEAKYLRLEARFEEYKNTCEKVMASMADAHQMTKNELARLQQEAKPQPTLTLVHSAEPEPVQRKRAGRHHLTSPASLVLSPARGDLPQFSPLQPFPKPDSQIVLQRDQQLDHQQRDGQRDAQAPPR